MAPSTWTTTVIFNKPINPLSLLAEDFILTDVSKKSKDPGRSDFVTWGDAGQYKSNRTFKG